MRRITTLLLLSVSAFPQSAPAPTNPKASNAWMKVPSNSDSADTVSAALRKLRDEAFDKGLASPVRLTPENAGGYNIAEGSFFNATGEPMGGVKEFPEVPNRCVVIARFSGHRSFLSASEHSVYTEMALIVSYVFQSKGISLAPGSVITTAILGGTVRTPDGGIISLHTEPRAFELEPGKEYLLFLEYDPKTELVEPFTEWVISNGIVKPYSRLEERRARLGLSTVAGHSKEDVISIVQSELSVQKNK